MQALIRLFLDTGRGRFQLLLIAAAFFIASLQAVNSQTCGVEANGALCGDGSCCSSHGFCGTAPTFCGIGCQSQCNAPRNRTGPDTVVCGGNDNVLCSVTSMCCSSSGFCGSDSDYCGTECQNGPCSGGEKRGNVGAGLIAGIVIGVIAGATFVVLAVLCLRHRRKKGNAHNKMKVASDQENGVAEGADKKFVAYDKRPHPLRKNEFERSDDSFVEYSNSRPLPERRIPSALGAGVKFSYDVLYDATDGFSKQLGHGAFGVVYRGKLMDETDIAVKMLLDNDRGMKDFEAEVKTLGSINHANLVALFGFCFERNQPFLIYEYVSKGSLQQWIFHADKLDKNYVMPWRTRVEILKGTAKGLAYLHEDLQVGQAIIHLDIKPENILLNDNFMPKVADFGLAKLLGTKKTQTLAAGGTFGYMAPEIHLGSASAKMDVYSFGIVMLEVLSGRRHMEFSQEPGSSYLPASAVRKVSEAAELDVIDPLLEIGVFDEEEARRLVLTALLCVQRDPDDRPGMSVVLKLIEGTMKPLGLPATLKSELEMTERLLMQKIPQSITALSVPPFIEFSTENLPNRGGSTRSVPLEMSVRPLLYENYVKSACLSITDEADTSPRK